ncbi:hypothetical protein INT47_009780 [Mucor saturninus]|uniref:FHA domain-containing protein n=1 Tax=Mucor saturninus TaxID=64648 RepID=A0A8H7QV63_9FUNG|nr:hypothetical protein INT47_009780 [Mucor saturninus]
MEGKHELFQAQHVQFQIHPLLAKQCHKSAPDAVPVLFHCSKSSKLVVGRGHDATVKIGKSNKRVSREHVAIEHKAHVGFEMTILSPNGALIDHISFDQGEHVPITEGTLIEIAGNKLVFAGSSSTEEKVMIALQQDETSPPPPSRLSLPLIPVTPHIDRASNITPPVKEKPDQPSTLQDQIIQVLVYTRKSTMTCTDIGNRLRDYTISEVSRVLSGSGMIGRIQRLGKTADGSPKEDLYYYKPDLDPDQARKKRYSDVGRSARKCTMKDTQYFFRIPPKLTASNKTRKRTSATIVKEQEEDEELKSSHSSDDVSDMEVYELFKDV